MGLLSRIKPYFPLSRMEFRDRIGKIESQIAGIERDNLQRHNEIMRKLDNIESIGRNLVDSMQRFGDGCNNELQDISAVITNYKHQTDSVLLQLYRSDGESSEEATKRLFRSLPAATGTLRKVQQAEIELLKSFKHICEQHSLRYWLWGGSMLGALRHNGFIPWDDDIDLGMPRSDMDKLIDIVNTADNDLTVTVKYDAYAMCRQVRFKHADARKPVFLDIFPFDSCSYNNDYNRQRYKLDSKLRMSDYLYNTSDPEIAHFRDVKFVDEKSDTGMFVKSAFDKYKAELAELINIDSSFDESNSGIIYGNDNFESDKISMKEISRVQEMEKYFPLRQLEFEGELYNVPNKVDVVLSNIYGDFYAFPDGKPRFTHINLDDI